MFQGQETYFSDSQIQRKWFSKVTSTKLHYDTFTH
jgi:hypothetical protein